MLYFQFFLGTGAICIYPLLFSKIYNCKMTATEIDPDSVDSALKNVKNNHLQDFIRGRVEKKKKRKENSINLV